VSKETLRDIFTNRFTQKSEELVLKSNERNLEYIFGMQNTEIIVDRSGIIRGDAFLYEIGSSSTPIIRNIEIQTEKTGEYWYIVKTVGMIEMLTEEWDDSCVNEEAERSIRTNTIGISK